MLAHVHSKPRASCRDDAVTDKITMTSINTVTAKIAIFNNSAIADADKIAIAGSSGIAKNSATAGNSERCDAAAMTGGLQRVTLRC